MTGSRRALAAGRNRARRGDLGIVMRLTGLKGLGRRSELL
jgi:hypothetical protein